MTEFRLTQISDTHLGRRFPGLIANFHRISEHIDAARPDLVVNTSCEHIADVRGWLDMLPKGTRVLLQSNDYFAEPTHINCVASLDEFRAQAQLADVRADQFFEGLRDTFGQPG